MKPRRVVVKLGSSSLTGENGQLSSEKMRSLVKQLAGLRNHRNSDVILVSSGAVAAGLSRLKWNRASITIPEKQAAAAVGQSYLIEMYRDLFAEKQLEIAQLLLTRADIEDRKRFVHIRSTLETLLRHRIIPVVNENDTVAVEEIRFGDNDTLASLVALVVQADLVVLLTDIDGLYETNPRVFPEAKRITDVWEITERIEQMAGGEGTLVGTGGMRTKLAAAKIAMNSGIDVVVASSDEPDGLDKIITNCGIGTVFHARQDALHGKKSWLAHGTRAEGRVTLDAGAVEAVIEHAASLLIPGIRDVEGEFHEGAVVDLCTQAGITIAKGIVAFSAWDLRMLLERKARGEKMASVPEVVHRDSLVTLREGRQASWTN